MLKNFNILLNSKNYIQQAKQPYVASPVECNFWKNYIPRANQRRIASPDECKFRI